MLGAVLTFFGELGNGGSPAAALACICSCNSHGRFATNDACSCSVLVREVLGATLTILGDVGSPATALSCFIFQQQFRRTFGN